MNSIKNLFVIVMLMGVSYGAFQVINSPDPTLAGGEAPAIEGLDIQIDPMEDGIDGLTSNDGFNVPSTDSSTSGNLSPAPKLLGKSQPPKLPPLPPNQFSNPKTTPNTGLGIGSPNGIDHQMALPALKAPQVKAPEESASSSGGMKKDPLAFQPSPKAERVIPPPPIAPDPSFMPPSLKSQPENLANNLTPAQNQFQPQPKTDLQPVTPRSGMDSTPPLVSQYANQVQQQAQNQLTQVQDSVQNQLSEKAGNFAKTSEAIQQKIVEPSVNATDMLNEAKNGLADRANNLVDSAAEKARKSAAEIQRMTPPSLTMEPAVPSPNIDWDGINQLAATGQTRQALQKLSTHYQAEMTQEDRLQMQEWLDLLAGQVIYSTEHLLQPRPYVVTANDTLDSLANDWNVPAQLIYNINQAKIGDPTTLVEGTELKVVQGPFNAVVNVDRQELTLFLTGMYAGRFPIEMGEDKPGIEHGSFIVEQKQTGNNYTNTNGQTIAAGAAENPYGKFWIGLNGNVSIHESPGQTDRRGSIRLGSRDAADVYGILSQGSQITITR